MTVSTLRPNGDLLNVGCTIVGAATLWQATNDNSDSTYVDVPHDGFFRCDMTDLTLPSGALIKSVAARARMLRTGSGGSPTAEWRPTTLPAGNSVIGTVAVNWGVATTVTMATLARSYADADADSAHLTITYDFAATDVLRVFETYADITYVTKPVVTPSAPTGTVTDTNTPTIIWGNTLDSDGGAQTSYQVRVFTAAQYGIGGFDPATSPATVDTGVVASAALSWQLTQVLPDATYRAYVRVAQTVNAVALWSDYANTQWIQSVALPGAPTFVATADNPNGKIALTTTDNASATTSTDGLELQRSLDAGVTWSSVRTVDGAGMVDIPWVVAVGTFSSVADATTHNLVLPVPPGGIKANDLLIAVVGFDGNPTFTWPAGWTSIKDEAGNGSAVRAGVAYKFAVGTETGTIALTTSASEGGGARILCVRDAHTTTPPEVSTGVSSSAANANPDSLNPAGWGTENTLWIAGMVNDADVAVTAGPTNYYEFGNTRWSNVNGAGVATASRLSLAASEDPGAFTHTLEDSRAFTIGVRPRNAVLTAYDYEAPNGTTMSYRARTLHDYNGVIAVSAWVSDTEAWTSTSWWLKHPNKPLLNVVITVGSFPAMTRTARQGVFQAVGSTNTVVVNDTRGPTGGQITFRSLTQNAQDTLDALLNEVATLMLQSPPGQGGPNYVQFGSHTRQRVIDRADALKVWEVLDFVVVPQPLGNVVAWS